MQDFYRCDPTYEALAQQVARAACHNLVKQMLYEARTQAIIDFNRARKVIVKKKDAVNMNLTKEQYMEVNIE